MRLADHSVSLKALPVNALIGLEQTTRFTGGHDYDSNEFLGRTIFIYIPATSMGCVWKFGISVERLNINIYIFRIGTVFANFPAYIFVYGTWA